MRVTLSHRWNWSADCLFDLLCESSHIRSRQLPVNWTFITTSAQTGFRQVALACESGDNETVNLKSVLVPRGREYRVSGSIAGVFVQNRVTSPQKSLAQGRDCFSEGIDPNASL